VTFLIDTPVLVDVLRNRLGRPTLLAELIERGDHLATTALNVGEVFAGLRPTEESSAGALLELMEIYPITAALARRAGGLKYAWARKGRTLASRYDRGSHRAGTRRYLDDGQSSGLSDAGVEVLRSSLNSR